ncbi:MAG TPA: DUF1573 domain-containing protein [Bacteroidales bacterium]|nr:DUF1573 domain-containing protein [Bacteroidales bacterium]
MNQNYNYFCKKKQKMKTIIFVSLFSITLIACNNEQPVNQDNQGDDSLITTDIIQNPISDKDTTLDNSNLPVFKFQETSFDFGVLVEGEKVAHSFRYKNIGNSDLIITSVSTTCGCTVPSFSKEPLKPGDEAELEVVFSSSGKHGMQHKTITILANTQPNRTYLEIMAEVITPDELKQ